MMANKKHPAKEKGQASAEENQAAKKVQPNNIDAQYIPEQRTVQILKLLKENTDERHPIKQSELLQAMIEAGEATTENAGTLSRTIDEILQRINPDEYSEDTADGFRIHYQGYEVDRLNLKQEILEARRKKKRGEELSEEENELLQKKAPSITDLQYVHDLSYTDLDQIIQAVSFSDVVAPDEKERLLERLCNISSKYYQTPFYDREKKSLKFNRKGIYSRTYNTDGKNAQRLSDNLSQIQDAINKGLRLQITFNRYNEKGDLVPKYCHVISPYYIVVYHDTYYLICGKKGKKDASHYRIDLMTDIKQAVDANGNLLKVEPMSSFRNLPNRYDWDPEKYMSEHIYMAYDKPRKMKLKIPEGYHTVMHDWFGTNYRKCNVPCEEGFEIVQVTSSPDMMVHWAMQYAETVEVLDKKVREKIAEEIKVLNDKYLDASQEK